MNVTYEEDAAVWALEQVALLRSGQRDLPAGRCWDYGLVLLKDFFPE
jgi:hypothetical protein